MKTLSSVFVALALLAGSGAVSAGPWHDHDDQGRGHDDRDHDRGRGHDDRDHGRGYDRDGWRRDGWRDHDDREHWERRYYSDRGYYGHPHRWERGYRYDGPMYIVNDYRGYQLAPPPYGYRWVRDDSSYLLVSIGDNMIMDMVIR
ncbi:RcnB family protein [Dyella soli]|uniref:Transmembrane signal peptide protein n=1 Tax=Dyella soli TaxID=522319 RepID=A0A4R0YEU0_9GAMM|nr:RcnB family protein [Dyella soli]TCI06588.1 transmembrane signal peptide protein [Dyella soli]